MKLLKLIIIISVLYTLFGHLALIMAVPPGYASPVWPSAGIALAFTIVYGYQIWPGIVIGSFLTNIWTSFDASNTSTIIQSMALAVCIGSGAALQAVFGAFLIKKYLPAPLSLQNIKSVVQFFYLGGVLACFTNPTIGVGSLLLHNIIPWEGCWIHWGTWFVGDAIGVYIFAPLVLVWIGKPRAIWQTRKYTLTVPLLITLLLIAFLFYSLNLMKEKGMRFVFKQTTQDITNSIHGQFEKYFENLYALRSFYDSSAQVDQQEFHKFVQFALKKYPGIEALAWVPKVSQENKKSFIENAQNDRFKQFKITQLNEQNKMVPVTAREVYFPLYYVEPYEVNELALGFDLFSDKKYKETIKKSSHIKKLIVTPPFKLVKEQDKSPTFTAFLPIDKNGVTMEEDLFGFVLGVFRVDPIIEEVLISTPNIKDIQLKIVDVNNSGNGELIFENKGDSLKAISDFFMETNIDVGTRNWKLKFTATQNFLMHHTTWTTWFIMVGGFLFSGLLGAFILVVSGQTQEINKVVIQRTEELEIAKKQLEEQIQLQTSISSNLATQTEKLEKQQAITLNILKEAEEERQKAIKISEELDQSNKDLEQFAYIASHDLQEPMRKIVGFTHLLEKHFASQLDEKTQRYMEYVVDGARRMQTMIQDLLEYSKAGRTELNLQELDFNNVIREATENLELLVKETDAKIIHNGLPTVKAHRTFMVQLFQNLINNSLKYKSEETPLIEVFSRRLNDMWEFTIHDNGIGIDPQFADQIFDIFQRLHGQSEYGGTGIGLSICKRMVERHGGKIWFEPNDKQGATFKFTLPER